MEHAHKTGEKATTWTMGYLTACGCVFSKIDILHNGDIVPCCMLPDLVLGNITTDSLVEIWRTHPTMEALRKRRSIPMEQVIGCEGCEWTEYCNGSCPGLALQLTGDFNCANPEDCYRKFLLETENAYAL
jgi:radical SAM protein with 4Fe4S-binding SPASM domain